MSSSLLWREMDLQMLMGQEYSLGIWNSSDQVNRVGLPEEGTLELPWSSSSSLVARNCQRHIGWVSNPVPTWSHPGGRGCSDLWKIKNPKLVGATTMEGQLSCSLSMDFLLNSNRFLRQWLINRTDYTYLLHKPSASGVFLSCFCNPSLFRY